MIGMGMPISHARIPFMMCSCPTCGRNAKGTGTVPRRAGQIIAQSSKTPPGRPVRGTGGAGGCAGMSRGAGMAGPPGRPAAKPAGIAGPVSHRTGRHGACRPRCDMPGEGAFAKGRGAVGPGPPDRRSDGRPVGQPHRGGGLLRGRGLLALLLLLDLRRLDRLLLLLLVRHDRDSGHGGRPATATDCHRRGPAARAGRHRPGILAQPCETCLSARIS